MTTQPGGTGRLGRLFEAADRRHVPLRTILVAAGVVVATYLAGKLMYRLRDIVLLMLVAGFTAMLLNPAVAKVQRRVPRRGLAVMIVTLWAALVFTGLAAAFGVPLVNGITHLADRLPSYVASAQHGRGWIGHLVAKYHVQSWVQRNTPKLVGYAQSLSKPALTVGKGAVSLIIELFAIFVLVLLLLLEGPKMWSWTLGQDQQAGEAGLHDAQPTRGDREQRDDAGGGVGQQHQGGSRAGSGGAQGGQQAAVVHAEAAGGQQGRLPPVLAQHRPDGIAFGQQPLVQAGHRLPVPVGDPVPQALRHAPERCQRPVTAQHDHAEDRVQDERGDARLTTVFQVSGCA